MEFVMSNNAMERQHGNAICYSGYREGQNPCLDIYPSYEEIKEDLQILADNWKFLRLYDCGVHAQTVLQVIRDEALDFQLMLGGGYGSGDEQPSVSLGRMVQ